MSENKSVPFEKLSVFTETLFSKEFSATQLYTDKFVEMDLIVSGGAVHRVLDRAIPCKEGDICVICPNTRHGYETEGEENVTVQRILFDPKIFLNGDYGFFKNEKFCYGVFCEGTTVSYATLNKKSRGEIEPLFLEIFDEVEAKNEFYSLAQKIRKAFFDMNILNTLHLGAGGCGVCQKCAKVDNEPCRFPEKALSSLEAYGVNVSATVKNTEMKYINGPDTVTYFGMVLFKENELCLK